MLDWEYIKSLAKYEDEWSLEDINYIKDHLYQVVALVTQKEDRIFVLEDEVKWAKEKMQNAKYELDW